MTAPNQTTSVSAIIYLADLVTGTTSTIGVYSRPITTAPSRSWPLIKSVSGLGNIMGDPLPQQSGGTIVLDDSPGNIGYQRRLSDLFERKTPINQKITISPDYVGIVRNITIDRIRNEISLSVSSVDFSLTERTLLLDTATVPLAPTNTIGKYLPFVFGANVECRAYPYVANAPAAGLNGLYAYATCLSSFSGVQFRNGGVSTFYVKDHDGVHRQAQTSAGVSTAFVTDAGADTGTNTLPGGEFAFLAYTTSTKYLCFGGYWTIKRTVAARTGGLQFSLYELGPNGKRPDDQPIAQAEFDKADLPNGSTATYALRFNFTKPALLNKSSKYYLGMTQTGSSAGDDVYTEWSTTTGNTFIRDNTQNSRWRVISAAGNLPIYGLYGLQFSDSGATFGPGLAASYFTVAALPSVTGQEATDATALDWIVACTGIQDDSIGSLTSTPYSTLTNPRHIANLLDWEYDPSSQTWVDQNKFLETVFSGSMAAIDNAGYRRRGLNGKIEGKATVRDIYAAICKATACRMAKGPAPGGGATFIGLYAWGTTQAVVATFSDENSNIRSVKYAGSDTIVNSASIYYDKRVRDIDIYSGKTSDFAAYAGALKWDAATNIESAELVGKSLAIHGARINANSTNDLISSQETAEAMMRYYLGVFAQPHIYVEVIAPLSDFSTLKIFDIVEIISPELPANFGTTTTARTVTYAGANADVLNGFYLKRAQRYRAQIEGRQIDYNVRGPLQIIFTIRILNNYPKDPT